MDDKEINIDHLDLFHGGDLYKNEVFEIRRHLYMDPPVIFDIGANVGGFTLQLSEVFKESLIYAFEPVKETFELLKENTKNLSNVEVFNFGFSDKNEDDVPVGMPTLPPPPKVSSTPPCEDKKSPHNYGRSTVFYDKSLPIVDHIKLVDFAEWCQFNKTYADFIKLDVEGCEYSILKNALDNDILHNTHTIYIEINNSPHLKENSQLSKKLLLEDYNVVGDSGYNKDNEEPLNYIFKRDDTTFVRDLYRNVLKTEVDDDDEGYNHWLWGLQLGLRRPTVLEYFLHVASNQITKEETDQ